MVESLLTYETEAKKQGFRFILGVDEAGRGPLAGPVVAAAVCLKTHDFTCRIDDSKKLSESVRIKAFHQIFDNAYVGIGFISEVGIDQINILNASFVAMDRAIVNLVNQISKYQENVLNNDLVKVLVDGNLFRTPLPFKYETIVSGDSLSLSIACASIIAKTYRDRIMDKYDQIFPQYGFKGHKGYPTVTHKKAIQEFGPSLIHRKTFGGVL